MMYLRADQREILEGDKGEPWMTAVLQAWKAPREDWRGRTWVSGGIRKEEEEEEEKLRDSL